MQAVQSSSVGTIPIAEKTRHLGVILTYSLTWSPHVRDILKRVGDWIKTPTLVVVS